MTKPLQGIKIIDLSQLLPGPLCTQILADYGAEVIKIEPLQGEFGRLTTRLPGLHSSPYFYSVNRNKKSLALDLKSDGGKKIFMNLVKNADVVFEQYRPGTMDKLGLGYQELKKVNESIIYCALTGYGYSGPLKMAAGHDSNYISIAGILGIQGTKETPVLGGIPIADIAGGGLNSVIAILIALRARELTGKGQFCDVGMLDGLSPALAYGLADYWGFDRVPQRASELLNGGNACYSIYKTSDNKFVVLAAQEAKFWHDFCTKIGKEEWIGKNLKRDPDFQRDMKEYITEMFLGKTQREWIEFFSDVDICFSAVLGMDEAVEHPQIVERDVIIKIEDLEGSGRTAYLPGLPIKLSETPGEVVPEFAFLGQDSSQILKASGYTDEEIEAFILEKVIRV